MSKQGYGIAGTEAISIRRYASGKAHLARFRCSLEPFREHERNQDGGEDVVERTGHDGGTRTHEGPVMDADCALR